MTGSRAQNALTALEVWVHDVFDEVGLADAPAWRPEQLVLPHGRILRPTALSGQSYRIREEEVARRVRV